MVRLLPKRKFPRTGAFPVFSSGLVITLGYEHQVGAIQCENEGKVRCSGAQPQTLASAVG